jgi:exopolysaccharide production repressor protein
MVLVIAAVAVWSLVDQASVGTILLRVLIGAIILQVGYFLVVLVMVMRERSTPDQQPVAGREAPKPNLAATEQKLHRQ